MQELEAERKAAEEAKKMKKKEGFLGFLHRDNSSDEDEGSIEFSFAGLFKLMCCVHPKPSNEQQQLMSIANSLEILKTRFENIESWVFVTHILQYTPFGIIVFRVWYSCSSTFF